MESNTNEIGRILSSTNPFDVLGIRKQSPFNVARSAWVALQKKYNNPGQPDKNVRILQAINNAFDTIKRQYQTTPEPNSRNACSERNGDNTHSEARENSNAELNNILTRLSSSAMDDPKYFFQKYAEVEFRIKQLDPSFNLQTCVILREKILDRMHDRKIVIESKLKQGDALGAMSEYFGIINTLSSYDDGGFSTLAYNFCRDERVKRISKMLRMEALKFAEYLKDLTDW